MHGCPCRRWRQVLHIHREEFGRLPFSNLLSECCPLSSSSMVKSLTCWLTAILQYFGNPAWIVSYCVTKIILFTKLVGGWGGGRRRGENNYYYFSSYYTCTPVLMILYLVLNAFTCHMYIHVKCVCHVPFWSVYFTTAVPVVLVCTVFSF